MSSDFGMRNYLYKDVEPFEENKKLVMKYWVWRAFHPEAHVCLYCKQSRLFNGGYRQYGCASPVYYYIEKEQAAGEYYQRKACLKFLSKDNYDAE